MVVLRSEEQLLLVLLVGPFQTAKRRQRTPHGAVGEYVPNERHEDQVGYGCMRVGLAVVVKRTDTTTHGISAAGTLSIYLATFPSTTR